MTSCCREGGRNWSAWSTGAPGTVGAAGAAELQVQLEQQVQLGLLVQQVPQVRRAGLQVQRALQVLLGLQMQRGLVRRPRVPGADWLNSGAVLCGIYLNLGQKRQERRLQDQGRLPRARHCRGSRPFYLRQKLALTIIAQFLTQSSPTTSRTCDGEGLQQIRGRSSCNIFFS